MEKPPRKKPDFSGVPGEIVNVSDLPLEFGSHVRKSPYDPLLRQLRSAPAGSALKFGDVRAWASIQVRARKLGMRVERAEDGNTLYVRLAVAPPNAEEERKRRHDAVRRAIAASPSNPIQASAWIRQHLDMDIPGPTAEAILMQLSKAGEAQLRDGRWYPVKK